MHCLRSQLTYNLTRASSYILVSESVHNIPLILYDNEQYNRQIKFIVNKTHTMQSYVDKDVIVLQTKPIIIKSIK